MEERTVGFIQPVDMEMPEGTLTVAQDQELREQYPANVEGSQEFNKANSEAVQEDLREQIQKVLNDPKVRSNALINANDIKAKLKGWFRVQDLVRKLMFKDVAPAIDMLNLLCLFEMAYRKEHKGELRYKIILNNSDRLTILEEELLEAEKNVEKIKSKIQFINNIG
jgi:hypothetical protein